MKRHILNNLFLKTLAFSAMGLTFVARTSSAQVQALVDVGGTAQDKDPHPITYIYDGKPESVKEPVQYYTFFYTGIVSPDATVPAGENIQRVPIPNTDWDTMKGAMITRLTTFFEEAYRVAVPEENTVGFDENFNYVEKNPKKQGGNRGLDPRAAAEWTFYYDQFVLWQFYCRRVLLNDKDVKKASSSREDLQREIDRQSLQGFEGIDVESVLDITKQIRETDTDDKNGKPGQKKPAAKPPAKGGRGGKGGARGGKAGTEPPQEITVATSFDSEADFADPHHNDVFRDEFILLAGKKEKEVTRVFTEMISRIDKRADEKQRYEEWIAEKRTHLREFAEAWGKVQNGDTVYFDDTFYIITKEPIDSLPLETVNPIVRESVTPQDLINPNGQLKKPVLD